MKKILWTMVFCLAGLLASTYCSAKDKPGNAGGWPEKLENFAGQHDLKVYTGLKDQAFYVPSGLSARGFELVMLDIRKGKAKTYNSVANYPINGVCGENRVPFGYVRPDRFNYRYTIRHNKAFNDYVLSGNGKVPSKDPFNAVVVLQFADYDAEVVVLLKSENALSALNRICVATEKLLQSQQAAAELRK